MKDKELERILKALANKRRLTILEFIKKSGTASVGDIAGAIELSFKATSKHLLILSNVNILEKEQISLTMMYSLVKSQHPIVSKLLSII
jgi:DNA-binding transcriptional ArsR family regulator